MEGKQDSRLEILHGVLIAFVNRQIRVMGF